MAKGVKASVEVVGLHAFEKLLERLGTKDANAIVRKSQRVAAKSMMEETKKRAPVDTGLLKKSLAVRALKRKRGRIGFRVGYKNVDLIVAKGSGFGAFVRNLKKFGKADIKTPKPAKEKRYFYPAIVEYGSKNNPPHPFMRPAFDAHKAAAKQLIVNTVREGIIAAANRKAGK